MTTQDAARIGLGEKNGIRLVLYIPEIWADKLRFLASTWEHPFSDGTETEAEYLLCSAIQHKFDDVMKARANELAREQKEVRKA